MPEECTQFSSLIMDAWQILPDLQHSIESSLNRQCQKQISDNRLRLSASIEVARLLAKQGLAFRGHNESASSLNRGNFVEFISLLCEYSANFARVCPSAAPQNAIMTSPDVQKKILSAMAVEVRRSIVREIGEGVFCILVDESRDESTKEQMSLVIRFLDGKSVRPRTISRHHSCLRYESKDAKICSAINFNRNALSFDRIRGQGYDEASNMRGELGGLKTLIQQENASAFYIHCFAHRLQLALMSAAKGNVKVARFFSDVTAICITVGASCKRADQLRDANTQRIRNAITVGEVETGSGLNQESTLRRPGDTRWGSHYISLCRLVDLFPSVLDVFSPIVEDASSAEVRAEAFRLTESMCCL